MRSFTLYSNEQEVQRVRDYKIGIELCW